MTVTLKLCCSFFSEVTLELYLGDTERDGDLECLLLFLLKLNLELNLGKNERDRDLEFLSLLVF